MPVCAQLLDAAASHAEVQPYALMRAVGNLCIGAEDDPDYDARPMVRLLLAGLFAPPAHHAS